jgi:Ion channel
MADKRAPRATPRALDHYEWVLVALLLTYVVVGVQNTERALTGVQGVLVAAVTILTLRASSASRHWMNWAAAGAVIMAIAVATEAVVHDTSQPATSYALLTLALILLPAAVLRRIFQHVSERKVSIETILAAVCVYLLFGLVITYGLLFVNAVGNIPAIKPASSVPSDYLYLSFTSLTTVGFGDVVAGSSVARVIITLEAVFGQVFLVVLVAQLVSSFQPRRRNDTPPKST